MAAVKADYNYDDHLRRLLDQRAARADLGMHGRFPSTSDFSDSPSVYSHAHFSPMPVDRADLDAIPTQNNYSTAHRRMPSDSRIHRQRLNIPEASSLDLDEDTESSYPSPVFPEDEERISADNSVEEVTETHKVAYGPKMTVHSRAPWEMGEEDFDGKAEQDSASVKKSMLSFSRKDHSKKSRDARLQDDSRPSLDSVRSQSRTKQSYEATQVSAGNALLSLAQASMSTTSLSLAPSPQTSIRNKLSIPRLRSRTPSNRDGPKPDTVDTRPYQSNLFAQSAPRLRSASPFDRGFSSGDSRPSSDPPSPNTPVHQQECHPYANPDLVCHLTRDSSPDRRLERMFSSGRSRSSSPPLMNSETIATITDSSTVSSMSGGSQSRSHNTVGTPDASAFSNKAQADHTNNPRSFAKGISAPIVINGTVRRVEPRMSNDSTGGPSGQRDAATSLSSFAGWQESSGSNAPIKLISLEEAQARERSRSGGAPIGTPSSPGPTRVELSPAQSSWARVRAATSSSSKMKGLVSSSTNDLIGQFSVPSEISLLGAGPQRSIVRKRSGFMRLFNGKDKLPVSPPPVPLPPAIPTVFVDAAPSSPKRSPPPPHKRKQGTPRVPVPSLTPSLLAESDGFRSSSDSRYEDEDFEQAHPESCPNLPVVSPRERQLSARRNVPGLYIVTTSSSVPPLPLRSPILRTPHTAPLMGIRHVSGNSASTAPSSNTSPEFTSLNLRRVSAMFDAVFTDQLHASPDSASPRPALSSDNGTPTTNESNISPCSLPTSFKVDSAVSEDRPIGLEDQSSVIQTLQEQIMTARKAWQHQIWELEGQVKDLKTEVDELKAAEKNSNYCSTCGRGTVRKLDIETAVHLEDLKKVGVKVGGVVNRPRAPTGLGSRFGSAT